MGLAESEFRPLRQRMQMVFQDPRSLNPAMDLLHAVGHPAVVHGLVKNADAARDVFVADALDVVGLAPVDQYLTKYPTRISRASRSSGLCSPGPSCSGRSCSLPTAVSMLDMSVRAKVQLELMLELREELNLTYLYITHDLATAKFFCDRVAIMYIKGVELGPTAEVFR